MASGWVWPVEGPIIGLEVKEIKVTVFLLSDCRGVDHSDWTPLPVVTVFVGRLPGIALAVTITSPFCVLALLPPHEPQASGH